MLFWIISSEIKLPVEVYVSRRKCPAVLTSGHNSCNSNRSLHIQIMMQQLALHALKNEAWIGTKDGNRISFWDLYNYVNHNPELEALAKRGVNAIEPLEGESK